MLKRKDYENKKRQHHPKETTEKTISGDDGRAGPGSGKNWQFSSDMQAGGALSPALLPMEEQVQRSGNPRSQVDEDRTEKERSRKDSTREGECSIERGPMRVFDRASVAQKKRELGLEGSLIGRHLSKKIREDLIELVELGKQRGLSIDQCCRTLEINRRAYYRWKSGPMKINHGGGGGHNKITPNEEKAVLREIKRKPDSSVRRVAYALEKKGHYFIGKSKVAEILKEYGLNNPFIKLPPKEVVPPADMLLHEPWKKNLLWGTDWSWVNVAGSFMFLLIVIDWYSRKIISWGLFTTITKFEVVAVITEAVAIENIDSLPEGELRPRIVADHGSANIAQYTKDNIEVQGLELWLSGIGRPTGNARTERAIGTLKREEINLQDEYDFEEEAREKIGKAICDYNFNRPNEGNGGFSPNSVHVNGRTKLVERRERGRQLARNRRKDYWDQTK